MKLAELRRSPAVKPAERVYRLSLAGEAVSRVRAIVEEAQDLHVERAQRLAPTRGDGEAGKKPARLVQTDQRVVEIDERLTELETERAELAPVIAEHTGKLLLRSVGSQAWRALVNEHPARQVDATDESGRPMIDPRDMRWGYGLVDTDAVFATMATFVKQWDDETVAAEDWDQIFVPAIASGDMNELVKIVVELHEAALDVPKIAERLAVDGGERDRLTLARALGRPPSVVYGRVPTERHEHYDADDRLTGYTIVIREPEFLESDYLQLLGLAQFEQGVCQGCGYHDSQMDPERHAYVPGARVCPVCAGAAIHDRMLAESDQAFEKKLGEDPDPRTPRPWDGRKPLMRQISQQEAAEIRERAAQAARAGAVTGNRPTRPTAGGHPSRRIAAR